MQTRGDDWLTLEQAGLELGVDVRTVENWLCESDKRNALGAVRCGKQWRIPYPGDVRSWASTVRWQFKQLGIGLKHPVFRNLRLKFRRSRRCELEAHRFWVAAQMSACTCELPSPQVREKINLLYRIVRTQLGPVAKHEMDFDSLKPKIGEVLHREGYSMNEADSILALWPAPDFVGQVRQAHTQAQLEEIRRGLDYTQSARVANDAGAKPTAEHLAPRLHKDMREHINDTGEQLQGAVVVRPEPELMRRLCFGRRTPGVVLDFRNPQDGLSQRTFRQRYPKRGKAQAAILSEVYGVNTEVPSVDEKPKSGKTPVRKPKYED